MDVQTIIGPPGTGKTHFIEEKIKEGQGDFVYLTFNRNMAEEARRRINGNEKTVGTFHSILSSINSIGPFATFQDLIEFGKQYGLSCPQKSIDAGGTTDLERFLRWYDYTINTMQKPKQPLGEKLNMLYLFDKYEEWKEKRNLRDYTDIIRISSYFKYYTETLYVDEAQDLTPLMWKIVDNYNVDRLVLVGDPHQSINSFRGVRIEDFLKHMKGYTVLDKSYRFGNNVVSLADRILGPAKALDIHYEGLGQTEIGKIGIKNFGDLPGSKAILCRTNALASEVANTFPWAMLPISKEHSYGNGWNDDTFTIAKIMKKFPNISGEEFKLIVEKSPADLWARGTKAKAMKSTTIFSYDMMKQKIGNADIVLRMKISENMKRNIIRLMKNDVPIVYVDTIHSAKGLEFDHVMVLTDMPKWLQIDNEERRLYYVAATRARKTLNFAFLGYYMSDFKIPGLPLLVSKT